MVTAPRARSIADLFEEAKEYDMVLTTEPSLADAINARIDGPRFGKLAYTPRQLVFERHQNTEVRDRRGLFLEAIEATDLDWKTIGHQLDRILECWEHTGDPEQILEHTDTAAIREILAIIEDTPTIFGLRQAISIDPDRDVAVLGEYQFNRLDRSLLPEEYATISFLAEDSTELPSFNTYQRPGEIVNTVLMALETQGPDDIGVVVEPDSVYDVLLRSAFEARGIPYLHRTDVDASQGLRGLLSLFDQAGNPERVRLRQLQPLLRHSGIEIPVRHSDRRLSAIDHPDARAIAGLLEQLPEMTFQDAIDRYTDRIGGLEPEVTTVFRDLGLLDAPVTAERVRRLEYYLDAFPIDQQTSEGGVLLVNPGSVAHIDRPVVFQLGMDAGWTVDIPDRPWIDQQREDERHTRDFTALIQAGDQTHYLIQEAAQQERVTPCLYFAELGASIDSFAGLVEDGRQRSAPAIAGEGFDHQPIVTDAEPVTYLSQSDLNRLVQCPRAYMMAELLDEPDRSYMERGTLFHDFAEFAANNPGRVEDEGLDRFIEVAVEAYRPLIDGHDEATARTTFRIGMQAILDYLADRQLQDGPVPGYRYTSWGNIFADRFDAGLETAPTEQYFRDTELGASGVVDLAESPTRLVDYKSSSDPDNRGAIVRAANPIIAADEPAFQVIQYLTYHRQQVPGEELTFRFVHFLADSDDVIAGNPDPAARVTDITYYDEPFSAVIRREEVFQDAIIGDVRDDHDRRKLLEGLGHDRFCEFFAEREMGRVFHDSSRAEDSDMAAAFLELAQEEIGEYKYVRKETHKTFRRMATFRRQNLFPEDLDRFETFLDGYIDLLNRWRRERFPVTEPELDEIDDRDLILTEARP